MQICLKADFHSKISKAYDECKEYLFEKQLEFSFYSHYFSEQLVRNRCMKCMSDDFISKLTKNYFI